MYRKTNQVDRKKVTNKSLTDKTKQILKFW